MYVSANEKAVSPNLQLYTSELRRVIAWAADRRKAKKFSSRGGGGAGGRGAEEVPDPEDEEDEEAAAAAAEDAVGLCKLNSVDS
jgi:hypothetical protein